MIPGGRATGGQSGADAAAVLLQCCTCPAPPILRPRWISLDFGRCY